MAILKYLDIDEQGKREWKEFYAANDGVTFLPSIDPITGILSWDNNGHLDNPEPISLLGETVVMKDYKTEFPAIGKEYCIYIEKFSGNIYRYDIAKNEYIPLSTNPGGRGIIFVNSVPDPADAEVGVIYAIKVSEGKKDNFELWTKHNGEMIMLEGSDADSNKELVFAANYQGFPVVGDDEHLYIATENNKNLIYRWDSVENTYVTVGDKLGSVDAGNEANSEAPTPIGISTIKDLFKA